MQNDQMVEISDGLQEGDQVVIPNADAPNLAGPRWRCGQARRARRARRGRARVAGGGRDSMIQGVECKPLKVLLPPIVDIHGRSCARTIAFYTRFGQSSFRSRIGRGQGLALPPAAG